MVKILDGLNDSQSSAVSHAKGPLLIVAGAGTGKTTVITRRIAFLIEQGVKPSEILALAFGEKAAEEMEERVDLLLPHGYFDLQISTFHAFCEQVLREYGTEIGLPDFRVLDEVHQWLLVRNNLDLFTLDYYRPLGNPSKFVKALVTHFSRAKDEFISPEEYLDYVESLSLSADVSPDQLAGDSSATDLPRIKEVANAFHVYQKLLLQNSYMDFGDLINYSLNLFQQRPRILEIFRKRFTHLLVDEFQDTNFAQYELLKLLSNPRDNLTVVGDDDQSIYKFRGASISNILHFQKDFPKAKFITLTENYRNPQKILDAGYQFIQQNNPDRLEVKLSLPKKLHAVGKFPGHISVINALDYLQEAQKVVTKISEIQRKNPQSLWSDFVILARSHDALVPFLNALDERKIPHIYFANKGLYEKPVILDLLAYFRLLINYHDPQAMYRVLKFPIFKINTSSIIELGALAKQKSITLYEASKHADISGKLDEKNQKGLKLFLNLLHTHLETSRTKSAVQIFVEVIKDLEFTKEVNSTSLEGLEKARFLESFFRRIQNFQNNSPDKSLKAFLDEIELEIEAGEQGSLDFDPQASPDSVKLMTVHSAKGLEFDHVFVVGLVDKRFPTIDRRDLIELPIPLIKDILPEGNIHLQEERRLFYVALTRVKQSLFLTYALDYGGKRKKKPSQFLLELGLVSEIQDNPTGKTEFISLPKTITAQPVVLPIPKSFSFSQISLFRSCPLGYKYRYILRLPMHGNANFSFGLTIHKTLEKYLAMYQKNSQQIDLFGEIRPLPMQDLKTLLQLYESFWIDDWYENKKQKEEFRNLGTTMLKNLFEVFVATPPQPKYLEKSFRLKIGNSWFQGKLDRADETPDGLAVIDYKSGKARGINLVDKEQLLIYQWAVEEGLQEKVARLEYWFLRDKLEKRAFLGKPEELDIMKLKLSETIGEIIDTTRNDSFHMRDQKISHECKFKNL